jgi:hypothetical protein
MSKSITLHLKTKSTIAWHMFSEDRPQLDSQFDDMSYHDGTVYNDALEDFWQVADDKGGGLITCTYEKNALIIEADANVSDAYFLEVARFVISETAQSAYFKKAHVTDVTVQGNIPCPANAKLADICNSLMPPETTKNASVKKRSPKP